MTLDVLLGLVRAILNAGAGAAMGYGITQSVYVAFSGFVVALATFIWGICAHDATSDMAMSLVRAAIGALGGFLVQKGWATTDQVAQWAGVVAVVMPMIWTSFVHWFPGATGGGTPSSSSGPRSAVFTPPAGPRAMLRSLAAGLVFAALFLVATVRALVVYRPFGRRGLFGTLGGAFAGVGCLALCAQTSTCGQIEAQIQQLTSVNIAAIQSRVAAICGVEPTVASIVNLFDAAVPALSTVTGIATAICNAVTASPSASYVMGGKRHHAPVVIMTSRGPKTVRFN